MTITMIIAIIAAVIFGVFCFLCVCFLFNNQKDTRRNEERMKTLEYKMGLMGELINQKTDMLAEKMAEQGNLIEAARTVEAPKAAPAVVEEEDDEETISLEEIFGLDSADEAVPLEEDFSDIDISDLDFEDILVEEEEPQAPEIRPAAPVAPARPVEPITPPQGIEERFEIGKSGKKYSFSELEKLIRE
ncbi:MAG: hypothetical protein MJ161_05905 [Clostridia bacterium]|nr:hypothetical protein [Clostridia bacterium]